MSFADHPWIERYFNPLQPFYRANVQVSILLSVEADQEYDPREIQLQE